VSQAKPTRKVITKMTTDIQSLFDDFEEVYMRDEVEELIDQEEDIDSSFSIRAKYILDGATSLEEAADMARAYADYLEQLAEQGFQLAYAVEDDYGFVTPVQS